MSTKYRVFAAVVLAAAMLAGCGDDENDPNKRTPEQQKQADKFYDMHPTDRSKSKGY